MPLNDKQARFAAEYLIDLNATQAAKRAGYSERTAYQQGHELLKNPEIQVAVENGMLARQRRTEVTADRVVQELAKIAFANAKDVMSWGPDGVTLKDSAEITDEIAAAVSEASQTISENGGSIRLKLHDKRGALVDLGRHLGIFVDKTEMTGAGGGPIVIKRVMFGENDKDA